MTIRDIIHLLRTAPRTETPDGTRYIQLSDILAKDIANELEEWIVNEKFAIPVNPNDWKPIAPSK